jgi:hypothetical protein
MHFLLELSFVFVFCFVLFCTYFCLDMLILTQHGP